MHVSLALLDTTHAWEWLGQVEEILHVGSDSLRLLIIFHFLRRSSTLHQGFRSGCYGRFYLLFFRHGCYFVDDGLLLRDLVLLRTTGGWKDALVGPVFLLLSRYRVINSARVSCKCLCGGARHGCDRVTVTGQTDSHTNEKINACEVTS
jgi:hypothetical protein